MKSLYQRFIATVREWLTPAPATLSELIAAHTQATGQAPGTAPTRSRQPHANRALRQKFHIPHGVSGAKLARKALAGKVGVR